MNPVPFDVAEANACADLLAKATGMSVEYRYYPETGDHPAEFGIRLYSHEGSLAGKRHGTRFLADDIEVSGLHSLFKEALAAWADWASSAQPVKAA